MPGPDAFLEMPICHLKSSVWRSQIVISRNKEGKPSFSLRSPNPPHRPRKTARKPDKVNLVRFLVDIYLFLRI